MTEAALGSNAAIALVPAEMLTQRVPGTALIPAGYGHLEACCSPTLRMRKLRHGEMKEGAHGCTALKWKRPDDRVRPLLSALSRGKIISGSLKERPLQKPQEFIVKVLSHKDYCEERKIRPVLLNAVTPAFDRILSDRGWWETACHFGWRTFKEEDVEVPALRHWVPAKVLLASLPVLLLHKKCPKPRDLRVTF